jgi:hypothetical protein
VPKGTAPKSIETHARDVASTNFAVLGSLNGADIEALAFLVLMAAAKSAQEDLKAIMASVKAINDQKAEMRDAMQQQQLDEANLKMQLYMDRFQKTMEAAKNMAMRMYEASTAIINNMK